MANSAKSLLNALGRVLIAILFLFGGVMKIKAYTGTAHYMQAHHVPPVLLPLVIALEIGGGVALVLGLWTRAVALALAVFSVLAIAIFLWPPAGEEAIIIVLAELGVVGGLLMIAAEGPGAFSLGGRGRR